MAEASSKAAPVLKGEFHTDGRTFVMRYVDSPVSGVGASAAEAHDNLLKAEAASGDLSMRLQALAQDQRDQAARTVMWRSVGTALVALVIVGGALGGAAAFAPRVAADVADVAISKLRDWRDSLPADDRALIGKTPADATTAVSTPPEGGGQ